MEPILYKKTPVSEKPGLTGSYFTIVNYDDTTFEDIHEFIDKDWQIIDGEEIVFWLKEVVVSEVPNNDAIKSNSIAFAGKESEMPNGRVFLKVGYRKGATEMRDLLLPSITLLEEENASLKEQLSKQNLSILNHLADNSELKQRVRELEGEEIALKMPSACICLCPKPTVIQLVFPLPHACGYCRKLIKNC